ncbi:MAG TPA: phosphohydrolase, partial [Anaeromyxobacteraceae bacterium]
METPDPSRAGPGLASRLAGRGRALTSGGGPLGALLVALVAGACAWLLTPGTFIQRTPGEEALGTPALGNYKAPRDYEVLDEEATRELRAAATAAERPVFDWDESASEVAAARIRDAFAHGREALAEARPRRPGDARRHENPAELRRTVLAARPGLEARLGVPVSDEDLSTLGEARFGEGLEERLVSLTAHALSGKVVEDRRSLAMARERGVVARTVRHGTAQGEHVLLDLGLVRDLDEARADVERAAAVPPGGMPAGPGAALGRIASALTRPTLVFDLAETAARQRNAADRVKPAVVHVKRGEKIIGDGEVIEKRHLLVFRGIREQTQPADVVLVRLGAAALVAALLLLLWRYARRNSAGFHPARKDAVLLALALLASVGLAAAGLAVADALRDRFPL